MRTRTQRRIKRRALKKSFRILYGYGDGKLPGYRMKWFDTNCGKGQFDCRAWYGPTRQELISQIALAEYHDLRQPLPASALFPDPEPYEPDYDWWCDADLWEDLWSLQPSEPDPDPYVDLLYDPYPYPDFFDDSC